MSAVKANKAPDGGQAGALVGGAGGSDSDGEQGRITRAAGLLGGLTFVSRVAGLARDIVIGALFGASPAADAFFVAFRIPNLMRRVVAEGATSTAFVPVFTAYRVEQGDEGATRAAAAVGGAALLLLAALVVLGMLFAAPIIDVFAPGFAASPDKRELTVELTRWTFPYLGLVGMAAWAMGCLHTFRRFTAPAIGPILLNVSIVGAALLLAPRLDQPVYALVVGVVIGGICQFTVQAPSLAACGVQLKGLLSVGHPAVKRVAVLMVATLLGAAVYQVNILVATVFASLLPDRSVSYLWYADRVFEFPLGIIAVAVGTAALPSLSGQAAARAFDEMADSVSYALRLVWTLCVPATVGLWILAPQIVTVLFERGQFSATDSEMTAWALRAYCFGLLGVATVRVLAPVFYALQRPRIPVAIAAVALIVNAVADLSLMGPTDSGADWAGARLVADLGAFLRLADLDHAGLALGTAIAATVNAGLLFIFARRRLPALGGRPLVHALGRDAIAAAVMGLFLLLVVGVGPGGLDSWLGLLFSIVGGAAVYLSASLALGNPELRRLVDAVARRLRRSV